MTDTHQDAVEAAARAIHERGEEALPARTRLPWAQASAPVRSARLADAQAAIAAYLAHLWRPIETAPKDGTHFLAYEPAGDMYRAAYDRDGALACICGQPVVYTPEPTLWMPLPAPPALDAAGGGDG